MEYSKNNEVRVKTLLDSINSTHKCITEVKDGFVEKKKKDHDAIQVIKKSLSELEKSNNDFLKLYEDRLAILSGISKSVIELQMDEFNENYETMFTLINYNLLDNLVIRKDTNALGIRYYIMEGSNVLGSIEVINNDDKIVHVKILTDEQNFNLEHYYIIYPIVTYINTNYNYKFKNIN